MSSSDLGRFLTKVRKDSDGCWIWTGALQGKGAKTGSGYGSFRLEGRVRPAHRVAYEHFVGEIPAGLTLDHLCEVTSCVNPSHLEEVTHLVNIGRSARARKTHCKRGHELSGDNLYVHITSGSRVCKTCRAAHVRACKARTRVGAAA